jgi:hypothetical protein
MRSITLLFLMTASCVFAEQGGECRDVGGGILTNLIDSADTLGTATGDWKGGLGVQILSEAAGPNGTLILHVHHHWVTETGETLSFDDAYVTLFPSGVSGFYAASYVDGIKMTGGTGRFNGATGTLAAWGAIDLNKKQLTLRYAGRVCFAD